MKAALVFITLKSSETMEAKAIYAERQIMGTEI
jgi:hypothetical protein